MNATIIPILGILLPMVLVPAILGIRYARVERELDHAERMKALELGRTLPKDESWWSPARISVAFGVGLPIGVFVCAAKAASEPNAWSLVIWLAAGVVGLAGVISGACLAFQHFGHAANPRRDGDHAGSKPVFEADAFDVVGSRGY